MKKIISTLLISLLLITGLAAATIDSNKGYYDVTWGMTPEEVNKEGYHLVELSGELKETFQKGYVEPVDFYATVPNDKKVETLIFLFNNNKLFAIREIVDIEPTQKELERRYGSFSKRKITFFNTFWADFIFNKDKVDYSSIFIQKLDNKIGTELFYWDEWKKLSVSGRQLAGIKSESIADNMTTLVSKLLPSDGNKSSFAFITFSSDSGNKAVENYITDALTEAMFNTNAVTIIERQNVDKIIEEQKFQYSGLVDESTAASIGSIAGVQYICYGSIKELEKDIIINARVIDVESGEICAMSRETLPKDEYLLQANTSAPSSSYSKKSPAKVSTNNLWQVTSTRNEFDGYTTYTFTLPGPSNTWLFVGYDKYDQPSQSKVRAGVTGNDWYYGTFDFKTEDGNKINKRFSYASWSRETGWKDGRNYFDFTWNKGESPRFFLDLFLENDFLTVRHSNKVQRFQTSGLWEKIAAEGITKEELENAIANEEF